MPDVIMHKNLSLPVYIIFKSDKIDLSVILPIKSEHIFHVYFFLF